MEFLERSALRNGCRKGIQTSDVSTYFGIAFLLTIFLPPFIINGQVCSLFLEDAALKKEVTAVEHALIVTASRVNEILLLTMARFLPLHSFPFPVQYNKQSSIAYLLFA